MNAYKTVIFDLDGTLLYTLPGIRTGLNLALRAHGFAGHSLEAVRGFVGNGARNLVARALPQGFDTPAYEAVYADYRRLYALHTADGAAPYPGIPALLSALREGGLRLGVVSNKDESDAVPLMERYFPGFIDVTVGRREGQPIKPAPDGALLALSRLGGEAAGCLFVGDSDVDAQTAKNAALSAALVSWGYQDRERLARCGVPVADTPAELLAIISEEK